MNTFNRYASLSQLLKEAPFTFTMLVINVTVFIAGMILNLFDISLLDLGFLHRILVFNYGEYYRIVTSAFLHANFIHLAFNMIIGLYLLTAGLERIIGSKKTAAIYTFSLLFSAGFVMLWNEIMGNMGGTVGASGAIFGALGSLLYISIYRHDLMHQGERQWIWQLIIINMIFTLFVGNISIPGHLGGLAAGYLISYLFISKTPPQIIYNTKEYDAYQDDDYDWYN